MARKPKTETRTVSICVNNSERENVRTAAALFDTSVSAWGNAKLAARYQPQRPWRCPEDADQARQFRRTA